MSITWPVGVPQNALIDSYQESIMPNVAEFTPEVGMPLLSRRTSEEVEQVQFVCIMTFAQYATLKDFRKITLKSGVLPFQRNHPRTGVSVTAIFTELSGPEVVSGTNCRVQMTMLVTVD